MPCSLLMWCETMAVISPGAYLNLRNNIPRAGTMIDDQPFDRDLLRQRRERAARDPDSAGADFLFAEAAHRLADRLMDVRRPFTDVLELGARRGVLRATIEQLAPPMAPHAAGARYVATEASARWASALPYTVQADEETLPFAAQSADLVLSNLSLHHVNDLPGTLSQIMQVLRPDGLFMAVMLGGETLAELRACMVEAESEVTGGVHPRFSPMADLRQAAALLQRAGFALPVADSERVTVRYQEPLRLLADLRAMGESNIRRDRSRQPLRRAVLGRALALYRERFGGADGRVPASFDLIFFTGWRPDASQPQPLRPGTASTRLAAALGTTEQSADDVVAPAIQTRQAEPTDEPTAEPTGATGKPSDPETR